MPADFSITPLALAEPVPHGSRGRSGAFTATSLQVHVHLSAGPGEGPSFCAIGAYSRRQGKQPPAEITLSLGDAVELAETILREVHGALPVRRCGACTTPLSYETQDGEGQPTYCTGCDRAVEPEEVSRVLAP